MSRAWQDCAVGGGPPASTNEIKHESSSTRRGHVREQRRALGRAGTRLACAALAATVSAAVWMGCASKPPAPPPYTPPTEWLAVQFDGRDWKAVERTRTPLLAQEVFVLPGETTKDWTELVTMSLSFGGQRGVDLKTVLTQTQKALEKDCPAVVFETLLLEKRDALFTWSRPNCKKDQKAQTEIVRISSGLTGLHRVAYQAKREEIASGLRRQWIDALRSAKLGPREPEPAAAQTPASP